MEDALNDMQTRHVAPAPAAGITPMLSVLLLLLAFFIVLVSMVEFDEQRTQAALGSLSATFAAQSADVSADADGAAEGAEGAIQRLAVEIGKVLKTLLPDGSFTVVIEGSAALVRIDNAMLFASGLTPAPVLEAFADRMANLLDTAPERFRHEVQVIEPFGEAGATRRAGIIVRALEAAGISPDRLMTGLAIVTPGQTRLEIRTPGQAVRGQRQAPRVPVQ